MKESLREKIFIKNDKYAEELYVKDRIKKARKIKAILADCGKISGDLLDVGCSVGIISQLMQDRFSVTGIDLDHQAVSYATGRWPGINFIVGSGQETGMLDKKFDVIICAGVYEHVNDPVKLLDEIYRLLRDDGVCYFTAMNRLIPIEPHYNLPFLSLAPKKLADIIVRMKTGHDYDVNSLFLPGLRRLVSRFKVIDYTIKVIEFPERFYATDMVIPNSVFQWIALFISRYAYWAVPTYIWILKK